mmetsp:Transcript_11324/g.29922  ORF Transcript_11324/g.29922 Transcript_11324/m.29922 type:complete len:201 (-) Transcript_11324:2158-2760(-)
MLDYLACIPRIFLPRHDYVTSDRKRGRQQRCRHLFFQPHISFQHHQAGEGERVCVKVIIPATSTAFGIHPCFLPIFVLFHPDYPLHNEEGFEVVHLDRHCALQLAFNAIHMLFILVAISLCERGGLKSGNTALHLDGSASRAVDHTRYQRWTEVRVVNIDHLSFQPFRNEGGRGGQLASWHLLCFNLNRDGRETGEPAKY